MCFNFEREHSKVALNGASLNFTEHKKSVARALWQKAIRDVSFRGFRSAVAEKFINKELPSRIGCDSEAELERMQSIHDNLNSHKSHKFIVFAKEWKQERLLNEPNKLLSLNLMRILFFR